MAVSSFAREGEDDPVRIPTHPILRNWRVGPIRYANHAWGTRGNLRVYHGRGWRATRANFPVWLAGTATGLRPYPAVMWRES